MTFSGSSTQSSLNEIQRQLSSVKAVVDSLKSNRNGVNCHWLSSNKWFRGQRFTNAAEILTTGTVNQTKYTSSDLPVEWNGLLNGVVSTTSELTPVRLTVSIQGRFLYRQYWFYTVAQINSNRNLFVNNKNVLSIPEVHALSAPKVPFYTETEIDSGNSQVLLLEWYGTASSFPEINAFQLFPLD
jgi:hypothetical protein